MNVPMVNIRAQYDEIKEELWKEWEKVFDSMHLMLGPNMQAFEKEFASFCGASYGAAVDSGTGALLLALKALGIGPDDEVITVSYTFFATPESVLLAGALPVMVDIDEPSYTMDPDKVEAYIRANCVTEGKHLRDKRTGKILKALLPVHLYGLPCDMERLGKIAKENNLLILEDCAQAHGAKFQGKTVGSIGDASAFSFYFSKNLSALGEGGIVLSNDEKVTEEVKKLRMHGQTGRYTHQCLGYNARLDELQAVVLRLKLRKLEGWNRKRQEIASLYTTLLEGTPLTLPQNLPGRESVFHLYVVRGPRRDQLADHLKALGIGVGVHYPIPSHLQPALANLGYKEGSLPVCERVAKEILTLPMYPHMKEEEVRYTVEGIRSFYGL